MATMTDYEDFSGPSRQPEAIPLTVRNHVVGTAYGIDNLARFYRFATHAAVMNKLVDDISDPTLSTLCQSTTPWDE